MPCLTLPRPGRPQEALACSSAGPALTQWTAACLQQLGAVSGPSLACSLFCSACSFGKAQQGGSLQAQQQAEELYSHLPLLLHSCITCSSLDSTRVRCADPSHEQKLRSACWRRCAGSRTRTCAATCPYFCTPASCAQTLQSPWWPRTRCWPSRTCSTPSLCVTWSWRVQEVNICLGYFAHKDVLCSCGVGPACWGGHVACDS